MFTLRPYLDFIEAALNNDPTFYGVFSPWVPRFNTDELQRPVQGERWANYQTAISAGWLGVDEVREREGLPPMMAAPLGADGGATDGAPENRSIERRADSVPMIVNVGSPIVQPSEVRVEHVPAPVVNVDVQPSEVRMGDNPAPVVNVHAPEQAAPVVNVEAPNVQVDVAAPNVDVAAPNVRVDAPVVNVNPEITVESAASKNVKFVRDHKDQIIGAEIEES